MSPSWRNFHTLYFISHNTKSLNIYCPMFMIWAVYTYQNDQVGYHTMWCTPFPSDSLSWLSALIMSTQVPAISHRSHLHSVPSLHYLPLHQSSVWCLCQALLLLSTPLFRKILPGHLYTCWCSHAPGEVKRHDVHLAVKARKDFLWRVKLMYPLCQKVAMTFSTSCF